MKIKTKKQLSLSQLIEWAQDNIEEATKKVYRVNENEVLGDHVRFTEVYSDLEVRLHGYIPFDTTFTVEVEDEITEDTVLSKLVERWKHDNEGDERFRYVEHDNKSINKVLFVNPESVEVTHFYIENDNQELVLIWKDGKLI